MNFIYQAPKGNHLTISALAIALGQLGGHCQDKHSSDSEAAGTAAHSTAALPSLAKGSHSSTLRFLSTAGLFFLLLLLTQSKVPLKRPSRGPLACSPLRGHKAMTGDSPSPFWVWRALCHSHGKQPNPPAHWGEKTLSQVSQW